MTQYNYIGYYLHADGCILPEKVKEKMPVGLIFDYDRKKREMWIVALQDTDCHKVHCPAEIPATDMNLANTTERKVEWMAPEQWHWEKLLTDVCHCALAKEYGMEDRRNGFSFDAVKANETLANIGIDVANNLYWTATEQDNGNAVIIGWGEINEEEPMPYSDEEIADEEVQMRLRMVGKYQPCE